MRKLLITGVAGFIGFHFTRRCMNEGWEVVGIDNLNDYYDVELKKARLAILESRKVFKFVLADITDKRVMDRVFKLTDPIRVIHFAAQAGVRYSIKNPYAYAESNLMGFLNILEGCRNNNVDHLVFASSSSVYGGNTKKPFSTSDNVDHPVSFYAATKKSTELMAHAYSAMYGQPCTGLRFFTVYGPWGRPDMALFTFTRDIIEGNRIQVFNNGNMKRDFTFIDDIVEGVYRVMGYYPRKAEKVDASNSFAPYKIYNIGSNNPVKLMDFIEHIEDAVGKKANKEMMPMQLGDVVETYADVDDLIRDVHYKPAMDIGEGVARFVKWYREHYKVW